MRIGLDLGTTTSTLAYLGPDGRVRTGPTVSSLCAWRNGTLFFGEEAHAALRDNSVPAFPIRDVKLALGEGPLRIGPVSIEPVDVVAGLMRYLARRVSGEQQIEDAVIGTPVNVSEKHRLELLEAAKRAGFAKVRLVYEPTAAIAGAIDLSSLDAHSTVLVVDWGGGTLDLSIVRKNGRALREVAVDGDVRVLGGTQMDEQLLDRLLDRNPELRARVAARDGGRDLLKVDIEQEKLHILSLDDPGSEDGLLAPSWLELTSRIILKGADVEDVAMRMADQAADRIRQFISRSRLSLRDITHVLLAGGVCKSDLIRDWLLDSLPGVQQLPSSVPQQLTGSGCAHLLAKGFEVQLASHFGVMQSDDTFCTLLPAENRTEIGTYRELEFFVTDANALEAVFDLGIVATDGDAHRMLSASAEGFIRMSNFSLRCRKDGAPLRGVSSNDILRVYAGIGESLVVVVYAESSNAGSSERVSISGVPMLIRLSRNSP